MAAKRHSESAQEREDRRQKDAQAKTVKRQSVDMRLKEVQAKVTKRDSEGVQEREDRRQEDARSKKR